MRKRIPALTAALLIFTSMSCSLPAHAAAIRDDLPPPDWVPHSFIDAMSFYKAYGATHAENNVICYVELNQDYPQNKYETTMTYSAPKGRTDTEPFIWEQTYSFEQPVPPSADATNAELDAYHHLCELLGWMPNTVFEENQFLSPFHFTVHAYMIVPGTKLDITTSARGAEFNTSLWDTTYSFFYDGDENIIKETDIYGWLPDCESEYDQFIKNNDTISVHDQYIVYARDVARDSGYEVVPHISGSALAQQKGDMFIADPQLLPVDGSLTHKIMIYEPTRPGILKTEFTQIRSFKPELDGISTDCKTFEITENMEIEEYSGKVPRLSPGDCNGDGELAVSDAVTLQEYLFGENNLKDWQNADLNNDGVINSIDFTLLKRKLIAKYENDAYSKIIGDLVSIDCTSLTLSGLLTAAPKAVISVNIHYNESTAPKPEQMTGVYLYDAETDERIADFDFMGEAEFNNWKCTIPAADIEDRDYYAAAGFGPQNADTDFLPVFVKSELFCPLPGEKHLKDKEPVFQPSSQPYPAELTLTAKHTQYGLGETEAEFSMTAENLLPTYKLGMVTLFDENNEKICAMTPRTDAPVWECTVPCHFTEECTKKYYAAVTFEPLEEGNISVNARTGDVSILFTENPAP